MNKQKTSQTKNMVENMENKVVFYADEGSGIELSADIKKDTMWATQEQIAKIFGTSKQTVSRHIINIFKQGELMKKSVVKESLTTAKDGKQYLTKLYNLDTMIAVGYRVNSKKATQFRIWATKILHDYLVKGYAINQNRLVSSADNFDDLREVITFIESKPLGAVKGKLTLKVTKNLMP